jgi:hypothetical protein
MSFRKKVFHHNFNVFAEDSYLTRDLYSNILCCLHSRSPPKPGLRVRAFCDICDVFDLHETEDCPLQSNDDDGGGTKNHGVRGKDRPYCEVCEG